MEKQLKAIVVVLSVTMLMEVMAFLPAHLNAGNLEPTGPPGPTMRTLDEIYSAATWSKKITNSTERFELVLDGAAVLDKETGLVWQQSPGSESIQSWYYACDHCYHIVDGGRKGWRLPTIEELNSLVDTANTDPALPIGHLFDNVQLSSYWSSNTCADNTDFAWVVGFDVGGVGYNHKDYGEYYVWCVRGGHGHDAY